ncbi:MAG: primosomal protein N' [Candidatus Fimisoma sp.]|nr:primosomal protein N' [Bacillota bacterium]MDD7285711.1 primosomal protein N' [Bacillota bacterium]MDY4748515.1 primosomal protein N' [Candidatus Fimisoma sp.]
MIYINAAIDNKSKYTDSLFTYKAPDCIETGDLVIVPFGKNNNEKTAVVCEIAVKPDCPEEKIKEIACIKEKGFLTEEMVKTALWMKQRYGIKYHDAFRCFIPGGKPPRPGKEKTPYKDVESSYTEPEKLTQEQQQACDTISEAIHSGRQESFLIHGVTSSGKTQVYMEAIAEALNMGRSSIMLVPEISLTKQIIENFAGRFGKNNVAVLHSKLTPRERHDEWRRIRRGEAKIVIGARMAVFAPLEKIGVIVMDEEHEASYKADMTPKYDTVDIAMKRLVYHKGVLILGSATPSVASYFRARQGIYKLITLTERYNRTPLPMISVADMRKELKEGNTTIFSRELYSSMEEELKSGGQVILLQNRRGYSNFVSCRECGKAMKCPKCGISLTYHKIRSALVCHYCGRTFPLPDKCPDCGSRYIRHFGVGTEQVEEAVKKHFPDASVDRLDIDSLKTRRDLDRILGDFGRRKTDILIGTQLAAKGLDFDNVGLVGIIAADMGLNIPDYRSAERTYQLITQAAGRAGRGLKQGKVVIQTYEPDNYAIRCAAGNDYDRFYNIETNNRKIMDYPPFTDLIMVNFTAADEKQAAECLGNCRKYIQELQNEYGRLESAVMLSPRTAVNFKGEDKRLYMLIKCPKGERNKYVFYLESFKKKLIDEGIACSMDLDINPYSTF